MKKIFTWCCVSLMTLLMVACGGKDKDSGDSSKPGSPIIVSLQLTPATENVPVGLQLQFTAIATLSNGKKINVTNDEALSWTSSDPAIATINSGAANGNGLASGLTPGNVTITASGNANGQSFNATAQLTVTNATVVGLQLTSANEIVPVGIQRQFTAIATLSNGKKINVTNDAALSWTSSDPAIATISSGAANSNGLASGVTPGNVTISASGNANGQPFNASAQLTVTNAVAIDLVVTPDFSDVPLGLQRQFIATLLLSDGSSINVTDDASLSWTSSDPAIATISSGAANGNGLASGVSPGNITITAFGNVNGQSFNASAQLTVTNATAIDLVVTPDFRDVPLGLQRQFTATLLFSDGSSINVTDDAGTSWTSRDPAIATISSGVASGNGSTTGVTLGTVTIDVTHVSPSSRIETSVNVTVKDFIMFFTPPDANARYSWVQADTYCKQQIPAARLPTVAELQYLYIQSTSAREVGEQNTEMCTVHGWPIYGPLNDGSGNYGKLCGGFSSTYWTSERYPSAAEGGVDDAHYSVLMTHGGSTWKQDLNRAVTVCLPQ